MLVSYDGLAVECSEDQARQGGLFLEEAMVTGMDEVVNLGLDVDHPERVPVEVEIVKNWGGG